MDSLRNTQARVFPAQETTTTTVITQAAPAPQPPPPRPEGEGVSIGMHFIDPATGEAISMNMSAGVSGGHANSHSSSTTTTTTTTAQGGPGKLEFTSEDGESFLVFIDGKQVGQFMGIDGQSIVVKNVTPGEHKLVIKDFMGDVVWASGRLFMDPGFTLKLGVGQSSGVEAFNREDAWRQGQSR